MWVTGNLVSIVKDFIISAQTWATIMKDFIVSAIIALLTADLLNLSNLVYQVIISILLLIIIFLFLQRLDKLANRVEFLCSLLFGIC